MPDLARTLNDSARTEFDVDLADTNGLRLILDRLGARFHAYVISPNGRDTLGRVTLDAPTRGTGSTLPAGQVDPAASDTEDVQEPTEDITKPLFDNFTAAWLTADDDGERTEALEDLLDAWYTNWPDTAVTSPHWPIADRLISMLGPWEKADNNTSQPSKITDTATVDEGIGSPRRAGGRVRIERGLQRDGHVAVRFYLDDAHANTSWLPEDVAAALDEQLGFTPAEPDQTPGQVEPDDARPQPQNLDATDDLWLIVAEVMAKGGTDTAMWEDDAREILDRLGFAKVQRRAAMLPAVLLWRDHTAAVLDNLAEAVKAARLGHGLRIVDDAYTAARKVLAIDPEKAYAAQGFDPTVSHTVTNLRTIHRLRHALATVTDELAEAHRKLQDLRAQLSTRTSRTASVTVEVVMDPELRALLERGKALDQAEQEAKAHRAEIQRLGDQLAHADTELARPRRYDQCDGTCTVDCGHCKGQGPPDIRVHVDPTRNTIDVGSGNPVRGEDYPDWTGSLYRRIGKQAPTTGPAV